MNILVTGSEGIIGSAIVEELSNANIRVPGIAMVKPLDRVMRVSRRILPGVWTKNLRNRREVRELFDHGIDVVIHAAAMPYVPNDPRAFEIMANDLQVTTNVLEAAAESLTAKHVVFLSSATVYENVPAEDYAGPRRASTSLPAQRLLEEMTETSPPPSSPLAMAKLAGERAVRAWSQQTGRTHTIWRLFNVVSPRERHDVRGHMIVDLYRKIFVEHQSELTVTTGARQHRCYSWIGDVAGAIVRYLGDKRAYGETFNLGGADPVSNQSLAQELLHAGYELGVLRPGSLAMRYDIGADHQFAPRRPCTVKAYTHLGWTAPTSFADCIENFVRGKQDVRA